MLDFTVTVQGYRVRTVHEANEDKLQGKTIELILGES